MSKKVQIIDNLLSNEEFNQVRYYLLSGQDDAVDRWKWDPTITGTGSKADEGGQFCLGLFYTNEGIRHEDKQHWEKLVPMMDGVWSSGLRQGNGLVWLRIKANMNPKTHEPFQLGQFHCDMDFPCWTSIYYINNNNGWTEFADGTKVNCVSNRLITFPSEMKHVGYSCTDEQVRCVVNFNYLRSAGSGFQGTFFNNDIL